MDILKNLGLTRLVDLKDKPPVEPTSMQKLVEEKKINFLAKLEEILKKKSKG